MIRSAAATAAILAASSVGAMAATGPTIEAGDYVVTTEIQKIANDSTGICGSMLSVGEVMVGEGQALGLGKTTQVITPVPGTSSPYTLGSQICDYSAAPAKLSASGTTSITGTVACDKNGTNYLLTTTSGNGTIVNVSSTNNNAFYLNATSALSVGGSTLCTLTTSSLNVFSGLTHK